MPLDGPLLADLSDPPGTDADGATSIEGRAAAGQDGVPVPCSELRPVQDRGLTSDYRFPVHSPWRCLPLVSPVVSFPSAPPSLPASFFAAAPAASATKPRLAGLALLDL